MDDMGSPKIFLANTSPINSAYDIEDDFDLKWLPKQCDDVKLDEDPLILDDAAIIPTQCAEAVLQNADVATEARRIGRGAVKPQNGRAVFHFSGLRSSLMKNNDTHYQSLLIAHRALTIIINREKDSLNRKTQALQILDKDIEILALHNEITRELIIRNNQNPNPALSNIINAYKQATDSLCYTISRGFMGAKIKMKHQARHTWGECNCNLFPADPL